MPAHSVFRFVSADEAGLRPDGEVQRGPLADLSSQSDGARQILVAPSEAVTLHRLASTQPQAFHLARAVPFALEDYLVEDIETLHLRWAARWMAAICRWRSSIGSC